MARQETQAGFEVYPIEPVIQTTIMHYAALHNLDYVEAQGLIKYLVSKKIARIIGKQRQNLSSRGKPSNVYELPISVNLNLAA